LESAPIAVSLSYAGSVVAVAAAPHSDAAEVGVDIEREPSDGAGARLHDLGALFAPAPAPDVTEWTLLEAALKADGRGLAVDLAEIRVGVSGTGRLPASRPVWIPGRAESVEAAVVAGPRGFVLSAAMIPAAGRSS
jgi:4'-phosphopantetheinyl transferase